MFKRTFIKFSNFSLKYFYPITFVTAFLLSLSYCFRTIDAYHFGGIIYRAVIAILFLVFYIPVLMLKKKDINLPLCIVCGAYIIVNTISIFVGPLFSKALPTFLTTLSSIAFLLMMTFTLLLFLTLYQELIDEKVFKITTLSIILLIILMCVFTYITEYKDIYNTITNVHGWNFDVTSIYKVKTEYGNYLLIGSFLSFIYFVRYRKSLMILVYFFFLVNMFLSRSKTSILISVILLFYFLYLVIRKEIRDHKILTIIILVSMGIIVLILSFLTALEVGFFRIIKYYFEQTIINDGIVVLLDRLEKWSIAITTLNNPFVIIFGYGERIGPQSIQGSGDNYYIFSLASGGIIRLLLYLFLISYLFSKSLANKTISKENKKTVSIIQVLILLAGLTDVIGIVGFTYSILMFGFIFINCTNILETPI